MSAYVYHNPLTSAGPQPPSKFDMRDLRWDLSPDIQKFAS